MRKILHRSNSLLPGLVVLLFAAAGCGGGGRTSTNADAKLTLTAGAGYNGSSVRFSGDPTSSVTNGTTVVLVTQGARTFRIVLPTATPQNNDQFTVGQNGTSASYSEASFSLPVPDRVWNGTGGTVDVQFLRNTLFLTLNDVQFAADSSNGSQAQGTFSVSGTITNIEF
ncbi:hypothetical protein EON82_11415 [bacterium]|nr:MAG: hypothetical protein EON82_11415 [bacterium]